MPYDGISAHDGTSAALPPSTGVSIHQLRFLASPSPIPAWALGSSEPIYTAAPSRPHIPTAPTTGAVVAHGGPFAMGTLYGGVDGPLFHGGNVLPTSAATSPSTNST
jgi:hypothetical protein